jgi:hypothetical protein
MFGRELTGEPSALRVGHHRPGLVLVRDGAAEDSAVELGKVGGLPGVEDDGAELSDHAVGVTTLPAGQTITSPPPLWDHLPVNPEDDPEARIRALEQPLSDQALASELGGGQGANTAYLPPPAAAYSPPDYTTPAYGNQQWGQFPQPQRKPSAGIPWVVFGVIAVVFLVAVGVVAVIWTTRSAVTGSGISPGGGSIDLPAIPSIGIPSMPSFPAVPGATDTEPEVLTGAPGHDLTVSGIDENKTITCNDANVTISGIRNTVNITGHCGRISVSGMNNIVTVDAADTIGASGVDNRITYHGGSPQIDSMGSNVVEQG